MAKGTGVSVHGGVQAAPNPKPGSPGFFKWYWVYGPGRKKWSKWRELYAHILKHVGNPNMAARITESWYFLATGMHGGSDINRVAHGGRPRGKVIGPG